MPETRMLPKKTPRNTGIERTSLQNGRPAAVGTGTSSHVSAAPGAGARVHQHVLDARNPGAAAARAAGRQDAKVEILDRRTGAGAASAPSASAAFARPTVEILEKPAPAAQRQSLGPGEFSVDGLTLMAALLGKYEESAKVVKDFSGASTARMAIGTCVRLLRAANTAPSQRPPALPTPTAAEPTAAERTVAERTLAVAPSSPASLEQAIGRSVDPDGAGQE